MWLGADGADRTLDIDVVGLGVAAELGPAGDDEGALAAVDVAGELAVDERSALVVDVAAHDRPSRDEEGDAVLAQVGDQFATALASAGRQLCAHWRPPSAEVSRVGRSTNVPPLKTTVDRSGSTDTSTSPLGNRSPTGMKMFAPAPCAGAHHRRQCARWTRPPGERAPRCGERVAHLAQGGDHAQREHGQRQCGHRGGEEDSTLQRCLLQRRHQIQGRDGRLHERHARMRPERARGGCWPESGERYRGRAMDSDEQIHRVRSG